MRTKELTNNEFISISVQILYLVHGSCQLLKVESELDPFTIVQLGNLGVVEIEAPLRLLLFCHFIASVMPFRKPALSLGFTFCSSGGKQVTSDVVNRQPGRGPSAFAASAWRPPCSTSWGYRLFALSRQAESRLFWLSSFTSKRLVHLCSLHSRWKLSKPWSCTKFGLRKNKIIMTVTCVWPLNRDNKPGAINCLFAYYLR